MNDNKVTQAVRSVMKEESMTADQAVRQLLLRSRAEFGELSLNLEALRNRREEVRQHIAALEKVLAMSAPKLAPQVSDAH